MGIVENFKNKFDIYGRKLSINIQGKKEYTTMTGSIFGFLTFIAITITSLLFVAQNIFSNSLNVIVTSYANIKPSINLNVTPILFSLTDTDGNLIDSRGSYSFSVLYAQSIPYEDKNGQILHRTQKEKIPFERCTKEKLGEDYNTYYKALNISKFQCIYPENTNLDIYGSISDFHNGWSSLIISVKKCNNTKEQCKSDEDLSREL